MELPLNGRDAVFLQISITARELMLAEPAATIGRERRRVNRLQHKVLRLVYHICLASRVATPQHIDQMLALCSQSTDGRISKLLPAQCRMAVGLMGTYGQRGIEQQDPLLGPARQITCLRKGRAQIILNLLEDILQRWRKLYPVLNGETQSMCLSRLMIRVLSDDDHLHLVKGTQVESIEDEFPGGEQMPAAYSCLTAPVNCWKYGFSNSPCRCSFHEVSICTFDITFPVLLAKVQKK